MIERVVEDWLTSINERQYQIPFCQLLEAEGETVVYISAHGQMEQGKDVITTLDNGKTVRAYQLKAGRFTLADWRKFRPEIIELVEYPIDHPSIKNKKSHQSFLVTNGTAADTVINAIKSDNKGWRRRGCGQLALVTSTELVARFVRAHGSYLPSTPENFGMFLDLIVETAAGPLEKEKFSAFLESVLPLNAHRPAFREIQRAIVSSVLLTTYIIQRSERARNHWAVFEAWVVLGAYILALHEKFQVPDRWWAGSFELVQLGAVRALDELFTECKDNDRMFTQGNPLVDGHFFYARITILAGLLSSLSLYHWAKKTDWDGQEFVRDFLEWYLPFMKMWGESAVPYILLSTLVLEQHGNIKTSRGLLISLIQSICEVNGAKGKGTPNPYYSPEAALRIQCGLGLPCSESFIEHSYCLEPLILWATRREMRPALTKLWEQITRIHFAVFTPADRWETFRWRAETGVLHTKIPGAPESWSRLVELSKATARQIPAVLRARPEFALFFVLVFPHRFSSDLLRVIDQF